MDCRVRVLLRSSADRCAACRGDGVVQCLRVLHWLLTEGETRSEALVTASFTIKSRRGPVKCLRQQLPILPDIARTVHKSQGLTLPRVVVNICSPRQTHGLAFVAMSRTKNLEDMMLNRFDFTRYTRQGRRGVWPERLARFLEAIKRSSALFFQSE